MNGTTSAVTRFAWGVDTYLVACPGAISPFSASGAGLFGHDGMVRTHKQNWARRLQESSR